MIFELVESMYYLFHLAGQIIKSLISKAFEPLNRILTKFSRHYIGLKL